MLMNDAGPSQTMSQVKRRSTGPGGGGQKEGIDKASAAVRGPLLVVLIGLTCASATPRPGPSLARLPCPALVCKWLWLACPVSFLSYTMHMRFCCPPADHMRRSAIIQCHIRANAGGDFRFVGDVGSPDSTTALRAELIRPNYTSHRALLASTPCNPPEQKLITQRISPTCIACGAPCESREYLSESALPCPLLHLKDFHIQNRSLESLALAKTKTTPIAIAADSHHLHPHRYTAEMLLELTRRDRKFDRVFPPLVLGKCILAGLHTPIRTLRPLS